MCQVCYANLPRFLENPRNVELGYEYLLINGCPKCGQDLYVIFGCYSRCSFRTFNSCTYDAMLGEGLGG